MPRYSLQREAVGSGQPAPHQAAGQGWLQPQHPGQACTHPPGGRNGRDVDFFPQECMSFFFFLTLPQLFSDKMEKGNKRSNTEQARTFWKSLYHLHEQDRLLFDGNSLDSHTGRGARAEAVREVTTREANSENRVSEQQQQQSPGEMSVYVLSGF